MSKQQYNKDEKDKQPAAPRTKKGGGWAWFENAIVDEYGPVIGVAGLAAAMVLSRFAFGNKTEAFPAIRTIAKLMKVSTGKAHSTMVALQEVGLVRIIPGNSQSPNRYELNSARKPKKVELVVEARNPRIGGLDLE